MELEVYTDHESLSSAVADEVVELLRSKPNATLCMASGETPRRACQLIVEKTARNNISCEKLNFIGLDEWVGVPPDNSGSCRYFFQNELIRPLKLREDQVHLFDALAVDLEGECKKMDAAISSLGGIDLIIVGIGMNGHIGFNEPGVTFDNYSHVAQLDDITLTVGQKYFSLPTRLQYGITLGLRHLLESRKAILMANGSRKSEVVRKAVTEPVSNSFPATIMQEHAHGYVMTDKEAALLLDHQ